MASRKRARGAGLGGFVAKDMADTPDEAIAILEARRSGAGDEPADEAAPATKAKKKQPNRQKLTLDIDRGLIREVRVACLELPPKLTGGGPSGFVARALESYLAELREKWNDGEPFESDEDPRVPRGPKRG